MSDDVLNMCFCFGYDYCKQGRECKTDVPLNDYELKAFEDGYARRYEEEQQLTNQCEEQEGGKN